MGTAEGTPNASCRFQMKRHVRLAVLARADHVANDIWLVVTGLGSGLFPAGSFRSFCPRSESNSDVANRAHLPHPVFPHSEAEYYLTLRIKVGRMPLLGRSLIAVVRWLTDAIRGDERFIPFVQQVHTGRLGDCVSLRSACRRCRAAHSTFD